MTHGHNAHVHQDTKGVLRTKPCVTKTDFPPHNNTQAAPSGFPSDVRANAQPCGGFPHHSLSPFGEGLGQPSVH